MSSPYDIASQDYSDEEIADYFSQKDPKFKEKYQNAIDEGYKPREIFSHISKPKEESFIDKTARHIERSGARIAETALGAPRAIGEAIESVIPEKLLKAGAEKIGLGEGVANALELTKKYAPYKTLFPSSEQIRKNISKNLLGESAEPKTEGEKNSDELISDFTSLAIPIAGEVKLLKPLMLAVGSNVAKEIVGHMGGTENEKAYTKLGTIFLGSLINPKGADKLKDTLYAEARAARPANATVSDPNLLTRLNVLETQLKRGGTETWKGKIQTKIKEIKKKINNNTIEVEDLEAFKTSTNRIAEELFKEAKVPSGGIKNARRFSTKLSKIVDNSLDEYGKVNPQWEAAYRPANQVHGAIAQSQKVRHWVQRHAQKYSPHLAATLFGGSAGSTAGIGVIPTVIGAGATAGLGIGGLLGAELGARIIKSPVLRRFYGNAVKSAIKEDAVAFQNNMDKLERELAKKRD